jgi:hypothetical protein
VRYLLPVSPFFFAPFTDVVARVAPSGITTSTVGNFGIYNKLFAFGAATAWHPIAALGINRW